MPEPGRRPVQPCDRPPTPSLWRGATAGGAPPGPMQCFMAAAKSHEDAKFLTEQPRPAHSLTLPNPGKPEDSAEEDVTCGFDEEDLEMATDRETTEEIGGRSNGTSVWTARSGHGDGLKHHSSFGEDIQDWVTHVSETFHTQVFILETCCQLAFSIFGPFSLPLLYFLYGGSAGLANRGFLPSFQSTFITQLVTWASLAAAVTLWAYYRPENMSTVELKFVAMSTLMRNLTISIKYAYMTTDWWQSLKELKTKEQLATPLMIGWYLLKYDTMQLQADISFIGIIGSRRQRSELKLKFLGWPQHLEDLDEFRARVDITSKTLYHVPGGEVSGSRSRFRKASVRKPVSSEMAMPARRPSCVDFGQCYLCMKGRATMTAEEADAYIYKGASLGKAIPLEDLFMYMLRGVLRSEVVHLPQQKSLFLLMFFSVVISLLPSFFRLRQGLGIFGGTWQSTLIVCLLLPSSITSYGSVLMFILSGAKDFWRRRALMRSCAALLSIQRFYRRNCPAEVDQLPPLDFMDVHTVEAWRKLRQVCQDWGHFYFNRIQAFATAFFICTLIVLGDLVASMETTFWREWNDVAGVHIAVAGLQAGAVLTCIIILVFLGHEVNDSAPRHVFLLKRQRTLIASMRHRRSIDAMDRDEKPIEEDHRMERIQDLLDVICDDISTEHMVRPIRLLGMYCGYSLLSALYFIPAGTLTSFFRFYLNPETKLRWF